MNVLRKVLGGFFLCASLVLLFLAYQQWKQYQDSLDYYEELREEVAKPSKKKDKWLDLDWKKLKKKGIVAWVTACNGKISYPVCYKKGDNSYFLHRTPEGEYSFPGSIFLNGYNKKDLSDKNVILYGHNMRNGSMFAKIHKYSDASYYKNHKYFYIYTPKGRYKYKIYQVHSVQDGSTIYYTEFYNDKEFKGWLSKWGSSAEQKFGKQANYKDRLGMLSTCTSHGKKRFLIQGYALEFETYDREEKMTREELGYSIDEFYHLKENQTILDVKKKQEEETTFDDYK